MTTSKGLMLIVEDDPGIMGSFQEILRLFGYEMLGLCGNISPDDVLLTNGAIDLGFIDCMLTGRFNGVEFARALRDRGHVFPMVAMSASDLELSLAMDSGLFAAALPKPFRHITDIAMLIDRLAHPELQRDPAQGP